jgi:hypothetical protein
MDAPFNRGLAWYRYKSLEDEFIAATKYFPFEKPHKDIWSEFFSDLLTKTCSSIDSFFRNMLKDTTVCLAQYPHVAELQAKNIKDKDKNINYFRDFFEPIYVLSGAEVDIAYGLTFYDTKLCPFKEFSSKKIPTWWDSYNHVKHTWFECIEEATLENAVSALAGLFLLNVLNPSSKMYLIKYQNVIKWNYLKNAPDATKLRLLNDSRMGIPKPWAGYDITASTPVFVHKYRVDPNSRAGL